MIMLTLSELHPHSAFLQRMYLEVLKNFLIFIQKVEKRPFSQILLRSVKKLAQSQKLDSKHKLSVS